MCVAIQKSRGTLTSGNTMDDNCTCRLFKDTVHVLTMYLIDLNKFMSQGSGNNDERQSFITRKIDGKSLDKSYTQQKNMHTWGFR